MGKKIAIYAIVLLVVLLVVGQLIPIGGEDNPPAETEVVAPPAVIAALQRSCYDCHSNQTTWPWYSRVSPVRVLVRRDVAEGRSHLNFSAWNRYDTARRARQWREIAEQVGPEGEMPPWYYVRMHPRARLSPEDVATIRDWALARSAALRAQAAQGR